MQNVQLQKGGHDGGKNGWRQEEQPGEVCAAEFGGLHRHHRLGYVRLSDGDDRVVRIAMRFRVGSGVVAPGVRLARVART